MSARAWRSRLTVRSWSWPRSRRVILRRGRSRRTAGHESTPLAEPGCCFFRLRRRSATTAEIGVWGDLDAGSAPELERLLDGVKHHQARIVVDLSDCWFVDATALGVLVKVHRASRDGGPALVLRAPPAPVRRVLAFCGLDRVLTIDDQTPDSVSKPGPMNAA